jgi:hypothetical protein
MERKIGEIFTYGNKTYQVVKVGIGIGCKGCAFETSGCSTYKSFLGHCSYIFRRDNTGVIFKLINNNMEIKNNQLTIEIPEGMEIDTENSSLAEGIIKFKPKYITYSKIINSFNSITNTNVYIHSSNTKKLKALAQLMNIARYYNKDWEPHWKDLNEIKYCIKYNNSFNNIPTYEVDWNQGITCTGICFKNREDAQSVINNPNFRNILNTVFSA